MQSLLGREWWFYHSWQLQYVQEQTTQGGKDPPSAAQKQSPRSLWLTGKRMQSLGGRYKCGPGTMGTHNLPLGIFVDPQKSRQEENPTQIKRASGLMQVLEGSVAVEQLCSGVWKGKPFLQTSNSTVETHLPLGDQVFQRAWGQSTE